MRFAGGRPGVDARYRSGTGNAVHSVQGKPGRMKITFYGVRGSIPSPGPATASFGGNTSCVHVELKCGLHLVFDAGTGIRTLGNRLVGSDHPIQVLLTHSHWDHIQGFPFFAPIHQPEREINIFRSIPEGDSAFNGVLEQMNGHNFPVPRAALASAVEYAKAPEEFFARHDVSIRRQGLNHPGGGSAYRIDEDGASLAFVTDNELEPPDVPATSYADWVEFCADADVLIHDAQYLEDDMPHKHGWGHSLVSQVRQLAHDARVGCVVIYHHDPERSDLEVDAILRESEAWFETMRSPTSCLCAWEGLEVEVLAPDRKGSRFAVSGKRPAGIADPATENFRHG